MILFSNFKKTITVNRNIVVNFSGNPTYFNIKKSIVRFDKDFALSFNLDDSLGDSALIALPAFYGGNVVHKDGIVLNYSGLFYTDGCGNDLNFTYELKVNGANISSATTSGYYINMKDFKKSYVIGCGYVNHSLTHADGDGKFPHTPETYQDLVDEILNNYELVKLGTGIRMSNFSTPSNYPPYFPVAYNLYSQKKLKRVAALRPDISTTIRQNYTTDANTLEFYSTLTDIGNGSLRDYDTWQDSTITNTVADVARIEDRLALSDENNHYQITIGSHALGLNVGIGDPSPSNSFKWSSFKSLFERIQNTYGKYGSDNMWMDYDGNVWEYLQCYKFYTSIVADISNNKKLISVDFSKCNPEFRYHRASFVISTDAVVTGLTFSGYDTTSYKINHKSLGSGNVLVNVEYMPMYERALFRRLSSLIYVENFELLKTSETKIIAQNSVNLLVNGGYKTSLQARIDAVIVVPNSRTVQIDFGTTTTGNLSPVPWNNFAFGNAIVVPVNTGIGPLLDTLSQATPFYIKVTSGAFTTAANGVDSGTTYIKNAVKDSFSTPLGTFGVLTISGLTTGKKYDIKILGSRNYNSSLQKYTVNGVVQTYNIQNNVSHTVDFLNITGVSTINVRVEGNTGSIIGYISLIEMIEHT